MDNPSWEEPEFPFDDERADEAVGEPDLPLPVSPSEKD